MGRSPGHRPHCWAPLSPLQRGHPPAGHTHGPCSRLPACRTPLAPVLVTGSAGGRVPSVSQIGSVYFPFILESSPLNTVCRTPRSPHSCSGHRFRVHRRGPHSGFCCPRVPGAARFSITVSSLQTWPLCQALSVLFGAHWGFRVGALRRVPTLKKCHVSWLQKQLPVCSAPSGLQLPVCRTAPGSCLGSASFPQSLWSACTS